MCKKILSQSDFCCFWVSKLIKKIAYFEILSNVNNLI